jgi:hypothetical protein
MENFISLLVGLILSVGLLILSIVIWRNIFAKAGYTSPLLYGILMLIPIVNFILLLKLAFGAWPIYNKSAQ